MGKSIITQKPPRQGYISELAALCGCTRQTVSRAIVDNSPGKKSEMVRKMYRTKYGRDCEKGK
ncbi:MAG: hypothetical protein LBV41_11075 [Cytophagaceae bacterium]|nr:hypothetical protein [Cytophagaceae bacterium]